MPFDLLIANPPYFVLRLIAILIALTIHEFSHALASTLLGDPTAKVSGRLTLNPLAHIDPLGFVAIIFAPFGWGKPVPFNPYNLKIKRWGSSLVSLAGPASNFLSLVVSTLLIRFLLNFTSLTCSNLLIQFLHIFLAINLVLFLFNLLPIPPLDGSKLFFAIFSSPKYAATRYWLESRGPIVLMGAILIDLFLGLGIFSRIFGSVLLFWSDINPLLCI